MKKYKYRKSFTFEGKRYEVVADSELELGLKMAEKKRALGDSSQLVQTDINLAKFADFWLDTYKKDKVSNDWYRSLTCMLKIFDGIKTPVNKVTTSQLQQLLNTKAGTSRSNIKKFYDMFREIFKCAECDGLINRNPAMALKMPKAKPVKERRALTFEERGLLLKVAETHRGGLFVKIMYYCGLRPSEISRLVWNDIDFDRHTLTVQFGKSAAAHRTVPIPTTLYNDLIANKKKPHELICTNSSGNQYEKSVVERMWRNFKREMDILNGAKLFRGQIVESTLAEDLVMYDIRHDYCTRLQDAGISIKDAMYFMGHSSISLTAAIYSHTSDYSIQSALELLDNFNVPKLYAVKTSHRVPQGPTLFSAF